jgi:hypothetical protein
MLSTQLHKHQKYMMDEEGNLQDMLDEEDMIQKWYLLG